nr:SDR family oxidoreductase [Thermosipho globiformans]
MENKVALITGGARNIGKSLAIGFLNNGYKVAVIDYNRKLLDKLPENGNLLKFYGDVSNEKDVIKFIEYIEKTLKD